MNSIYRSIWNDAAGAFVAVSENARSAGKKASSCTTASGAVLAMNMLAFSLMMAGTGAHAAPAGGVVAAGTATIGGTQGNLVITQSSQNAAINWQSFNVAAGESVRFVQPNSNAVALNRVLGADPSSILGSLSANGKVFLVNPNGILFGKGASVNVGGLVASSLNIADADFMAGNFRFSGAGTGAVVNQGAIHAPGGYVALLGAHVSNDGIIAARLGSVVLAAGNAVTLDVAGDGLLNVAVNEGAVDALVQNGGLIQADGGQVLLSARAAGGLLQGAINNTGIIEAHSLENRNGTIRLAADARTGTVRVSGTLDASGLAPGQTGGTVQVLGDAVTLAGATVNASGNAGGGLVQIGGSFHGDATLPAARTTVVDGGAVRADAIRTGNGGKIAIWSDGATAVNTTLSARGGAVSGNGGFIETSGKSVVLGAAHTVNTLAPQGATGTWLLDPVDWRIAFAGGDETPDQVRTSLASSDRLISATNDITVADALVWTTGQKLELNAGHDVLVQAPITASTAGSAIVLTAGNDVLVNAAVTASATGSRIVMTAGRDVIDTATITATATGARIAIAAGRDASVATVTADGGGAVDVIANGNVSVNGQISSDTGTVVLIADNDGTGPGAAGGTVNFIGPAAVNAMATTIRFNPATYASTSTEIANYVTKVASGTLDARAWVFAQGQNKVYDGNRAATLALRGNPDADNSVALVAGNATFADKNVGAGKAITFDGYTLGGADQVKFALFAPFGTAAGAGVTTADITPAPLTVQANNATKNFGQTLALASAAFTQFGLVNGETIASVDVASAGTGATAGVAGGPYAITPSNASGGTFAASNYTITYVNGALTIAPAPLLVTASDASKMYGETLVPTAFTSVGLLNGNTIGSVIETSAGTPATASVAGSPYAIVPSNAAGGTFTPSNYVITYANGTLTVTPAPLVVTAGDASKRYGQVLAPTAYTTAGLVNGDSIATVALTSAGTPATASVAGNPYAIVAATPAGSTFEPSNYAITYVNGALTVIPAALTVTADNVTKAFGETPALTGFTATGLVNDETIGSVTGTSPGALATAAAPGPYVITPDGATGGTFTPGNYAITYATGALTVTAPVVVPPVVDPPVVVPPVVVPPVVVPPVVVDPPVVVPPVVVPPVVVPPAVEPHVVVPPVVVPPVVVPPVVEPPVVVPPVVVPPVVVPPVVEPPVVVPPVVVPPVVVPPVVVPPAPVITPPDTVPGAVLPPVLIPTVLVPLPPSTVPAPVVVLPSTPAGLESLLPPAPLAEAPPAPLPATPAAPVTRQAQAPAVAVPAHRVRKQDRN